RPSTESRARVGSSASIASRTTSRWLSSAARRCVLSPRRVQAEGSALPRHPRGRPARRGTRGELDPAGIGAARLGPVAAAGDVRATTTIKKATTTMKKRESSPKEGRGDSPSQLIDARIKELGDWRGETLARVRMLIKQADPEVVEEWKWGGP